MTESEIAWSCSGIIACPQFGNATSRVLGRWLARFQAFCNSVRQALYHQHGRNSSQVPLLETGPAGGFCLLLEGLTIEVLQDGRIRLMSGRI